MLTVFEAVLERRVNWGGRATSSPQLLFRDALRITGMIGGMAAFLRDTAGNPAGAAARIRP